MNLLSEVNQYFLTLITNAAIQKDYFRFSGFLFLDEGRFHEEI